MEAFEHVKGKPSPRRGIQLHGPRPATLKVQNNSHKIKYPSLPPPPASTSRSHRPPVIIYTVSPKIIHTKPSEFMSLVQRLTGCPSSSSVSTNVEKGDVVIFSTDDPTDELSRVVIGGNLCSATSKATSLQTIPPCFFPPVAEVNQISVLSEHDTALHGGKGLMDNNFFASTGNFFFSL